MGHFLRRNPKDEEKNGIRGGRFQIPSPNSKKHRPNSRTHRINKSIPMIPDDVVDAISLSLSHQVPTGTPNMLLARGEGYFILEQRSRLDQLIGRSINQTSCTRAYVRVYVARSRSTQLSLLIKTSRFPPPKHTAWKMEEKEQFLF